MSDKTRPRELLTPGYPQNQPVVALYGAIEQKEDFAPEAPSVPFSHYLWILRRHLWKMASFVAICVLLTAAISARLRPIYESTAIIDVDREAPSELVGAESTRMNAPNDADQFLATQIKLIQSDAVLRPVAERYHLLDVSPKSKGADSANMQEIARAQIALSHLKVTRPPNTYLLLISYRSADRNLAADVANAIADSYLVHTYTIRIRSSASMASFMARQLDELKAKMEQSSLALAKFEKDLNVINPEEKTNILSARLLQLNTEYTAAQTERVRKEAALDGLKMSSLEAAQVSSQGDALVRLNDSLNEAKQRFALVKSTFGSTHPEYRKAASELSEVQRQYDETRANIHERIAVDYREALSREQMLQRAVAEAKAEWDQINAKSFQYQRLKQEADTDKALYNELIKKIREADINSGFQNNNIRIADLARPSIRPVFPSLKLNLTLAFVFSIILAIGTAILLDTLDTTLRDPKEASRFLGADVIATMPTDRDAVQVPRAIPPTVTPAPVETPEVRGRKGYYRTASSFDEAVRTLRNTILLSDFESRLHSMVITSAVPGEGKTTLASHLAIANADRGKKTLLVDGDLRRPSLHAKFNLTTREGLANVLNGELSWRDVVQAVENRPNLHLLPAGLGSHRAADLIGPRLATLLDEFVKEYDLVLLDSPPLLGFAECLQMVAAADGVLITSLAGETRRRAVAEVIGTLRRIHANVIGVVLNQVNRNTAADAYSYYSYYHYNYYRYRNNPPAEANLG